MKKYLGVIALLLLCIAMVFTAQAKETTEYGVDVSYTVDIPERVELENGEGVLSIVISEVTLPENHTLAVTVSGEANGENWIMHHNNADATLEYVVHNGEDTVKSGDIILQTTHPDSITLDVEVVDDASVAGEYAGVMTVSIDVNAGKYVPIKGLGNVHVDNPDAELEVTPDGGVAGVVPPAAEPETPPELPEDKQPELIEFGIGAFKPSATFTPGTYETVEWEESVTELVLPKSYYTHVWSKWNTTSDANGNLLNVVAANISLSDVNEYYTEYVAYDLDTDKYLELEGVPGDSLCLYYLYDTENANLDDLLYLAAWIEHSESRNLHIAKWNGTQYAPVNMDAQIDAIDTFVRTYTVTRTKQVQVTAPSTSVSYVYLPTGTLVAEEGMTWAQWLASEYNTTGETAPIIKTSDFQDVAYTDVIVPGQNYGFFVYELSGMWMFNETLNYRITEGNNIGEIVTFDQDITFTVSGNTYNNMFMGTGGVIGLVYVNEESTHVWCCTPIESDWPQYWYDNAYRTIDFGSEPQEVPKEFYEWFTANAAPVYTISGSWMWNPVVNMSFGEATLYPVNYYSIINEKPTLCSSISTDDDIFLYYTAADTENEITWYIFGEDDGWMCDEESRYIDFGSEPQVVSEEFYKWFTSNATPKVITYEISGKWKFHKEVTRPLDFNEENLTTWANIHGGSGDRIQERREFSTTRWEEYGEFEVGFGGDTIAIFYDDGSWEWSEGYEYFAVIDFGDTPQTVSSTFYFWYTQNADKIS